MASTRHVIPFAELGRQDVGGVGGKNASLGEMTVHLAGAGVRVPRGSPRRPTHTESCSTDTDCAGGSRNRSRACAKAPRSTRSGPRSGR